MQPDLRDYPEPIPSFQEPAIPPVSDPWTGGLLYRCYSENWQSAILGALMQLLEQTTWATNNPDELLLVQQRADTLIGLFMRECDDMPTGAIIFFAGSTPPDGYLVCDGTAISRANYAALFAVCGTAFGVGDGATTFNLPDLGGRLPIGTGQQGGGTLFARADHGGEEKHQLTVAELAAHSHSDSGHNHSLLTPLEFVALTGEEPVSLIPAVPGVTGTGFANIQNTGSDAPHNTLPPYLALLPCIRY